MQANPMTRPAGRFEFRFLSMLASHATGDQEDAEFRALDQLGREGWQIKSVSPDPRLPAARLLIALQRELD
jgi:hypothetical protein